MDSFCGGDAKIFSAETCRQRSDTIFFEAAVKRASNGEVVELYRFHFHPMIGWNQAAERRFYMGME
jgi:uncharacterized heparinase superfamily protein